MRARLRSFLRLPPLLLNKRQFYTTNAAGSVSTINTGDYFLGWHGLATYAPALWSQYIPLDYGIPFDSTPDLQERASCSVQFGPSVVDINWNLGEGEDITPGQPIICRIFLVRHFDNVDWGTQVLEPQDMLKFNANWQDAYASEFLSKYDRDNTKTGFQVVRQWRRHMQNPRRDIAVLISPYWKLRIPAHTVHYDPTVDAGTTAIASLAIYIVHQLDANTVATTLGTRSTSYWWETVFVHFYVLV